MLRHHFRPGRDFRLPMLPDALLRQLPFQEGRDRAAIGLHALTPKHWIEPGADLLGALALKAKLLDERRDEVLAVSADPSAAASELLAMLVNNLLQFHGDRFASEDGDLRDRAAGRLWRLRDPDLHPIELAARLIAEDICLLTKSDRGYVLSEACVCFPARWRLKDKIGRNMLAIHAPVPSYASQLAVGVGRFFEALRPGKMAWRANWSIVDDPTLFQPERPPSAVEVTERNAFEALWLRVERQSFVQLPETGTIVFTIRTYVDRLEEVIGDPVTARNLASTIRSTPEDVLRYKHILPFAQPLLARLDGFRSLQSGMTLD